MPGFIRTCSVALVVAGIALAGVWAGCNITIQMPPDGDDDAQVGGSTPDNPDNETPPANDPTPPTDDAGGNPNSQCADQTNVHVTYKNEASGRVSFVESFRDESYAVLAGSILVLEPAGTTDDTRSKCIACPNQAGIRNLQYMVNGAWISVPYPDDVFRGEFQCGDNITFIFNSNRSVSIQVETP